MASLIEQSVLQAVIDHLLQTGQPPGVQEFRLQQRDHLNTVKQLELRHLARSWERYYPTPFGTAVSGHQSADEELEACRRLLAKLGDAYASNPNRDWWTPTDISAAVGIDEDQVNRALIHLSAAKLLDTHYPAQETGLIGRLRITDRFLEPSEVIARFDTALNGSQPVELPLLPDLYEYIGELGCGGFGVVRRYRHRLLELDFAIKTLDPTFRGASEKDVKRFYQEVKILFRLRHPNIIQVHELGLMPDGKPYMRLELFEGEPLSTILLRGRLQPSEALALVLKVTGALAHAHHRNVYHRDLKPSNLLVDGSGDCRVIDFGLSIWLEAVLKNRLSSGTELLGGAHTAPELRIEPLLMDPRTDVFSIGSLWYEMVVGRVPSTDPEGVLLREVRGLPREQRNLILSCLSEEPANRPPTADDLLEALGGATTLASMSPRLGAARFAGIVAASADRGDRLTADGLKILDYGIPPHGTVEHQQSRFFLLKGGSRVLFKARVGVSAPPSRALSLVSLEVEIGGQRLPVQSKTTIEVQWRDSGTRRCVVGNDLELWDPSEPLVVGAGEMVVRKVCGVLDANALDREADVIRGHVTARDAQGVEWRSPDLEFRRYCPQ